MSATIRDIAIIIIAIESIVIAGLLIVLVWQEWRLVKMIQTEIKPILDDAKATTQTARGTATFVSEHVSDPVIRTNRTVAKVRGTVNSLRAGLRPSKSAK